jgi:hypothetical protein
MGMVWIARLADDEQTAGLRANPDTLADFISGEELDWSTVPERQKALDPEVPFDVDKQWHAIHYLLTGSADPVDHPLGVIMGIFEEVGEDEGYGPPWFISAAQLKASHDALLGLSDDELRRRYDPQAMVRDDVYIAGALVEEGAEGLGFLLKDIQRLRAFVRAGAERSLNAFAFIT